MVTLLEVFKDFDVTVESWTYRPKYNIIKLITPKENPKIITLEDLENYVQRLAERYPERGFRIRKYKNFHVIDQKFYPPEYYQEKEDILETMRFHEARRRRYPPISALERLMIIKKLKTLRNRLKKLKRNRKKDRIPIYFDLDQQRVFVPKTYVKRNKSLTNYICMITLGALGVSQSRYIGRR